jgi:S-adenosylmethionine:tRNA ribosyltransferase-isomerase
LKTSEFDYDLPAEFIAQTPTEPRDASRLLVLDRHNDRLEHAHFYDLGKYLRPGDVLVLNQTRVIPARLYGWKIPSGGRIELLLLHPQDNLTWEVLVGGKGLSVGRRVQVEAGPQAEVTAVLEGSRRLVRFTERVEPYLERIGHVPLPPYIHTSLADPERYQTVYAHQPGSAAAPTAGLHFTPALLASLEKQGVMLVQITLHVGLDTFAPVNEANPEEHQIHTEWCQVPSQAAETINHLSQQGGRVIAVGTTSVRSLEAAARAHVQAGTGGKERLQAYEGATDLFILPGHRFLAVDGMVTNFHLPRSTLIMLVSAFAGRERIMQAYETAKNESYRFYSFGDAMLIL